VFRFVAEAEDLGGDEPFSRTLNLATARREVVTGAEGGTGLEPVV
jgi:hypothetical protein